MSDFMPISQVNLSLNEVLDTCVYRDFTLPDMSGIVYRRPPVSALEGWLLMVRIDEHF